MSEAETKHLVSVLVEARPELASLTHHEIYEQVRKFTAAMVGVARQRLAQLDPGE